LSKWKKAWANLFQNFYLGIYVAVKP